MSDPQIGGAPLSSGEDSDDAEDTWNEALIEPLDECDNEDAISRRTRARHSLAHYTLEELETFLQESDDENNAPNVDDEKEYRKFLAAVLRRDDGEDGEENENEDEENDVDFELEIQEALESDVEEDARRGEDKRRGGRPETRQKKLQRDQQKPLGAANVPLRPILPSGDFPNCYAAFPLTGTGFQGFTAEQISQLYCLIHEHVQLLIQVFSLCVLDPSRQHIASCVQKLIVEIVTKREEALARKSVPYPSFCFENIHIYQSDFSGLDQNLEGGSWAPSFRNPVCSILDVSLLALAKNYMADVSVAVLKYRGSQLEAVQDSDYTRKEPLFLSPTSPVSEIRNNPKDGIPTHQDAPPPKKSFAAALVENTKKQSVALVPKDIADLARRFLPLFNSTLYPHKPPFQPVANRILFTDSEDRLLALGLMEYNNDWVSIQQRFLPCKSEHQIFVRQKNRASSKSPENPIKAVRRLKASPLSANEIHLISKGLKVFKNDWLAVWQCFLPYRDPSLLPRQWRVATGIQKSYKKSETVKEKRRLYEAKRRRLKASISLEQAAPERKVDDSPQKAADHDMNDDDQAYVHEAFLAESEVGSSKSMLHPKSQANALPFMAPKPATTKIVKLAPDLPPVNLPPSVRVISHSTFQSYSSVSSQMNIADGTRNLVQRLPDAVRTVNVPTNSRVSEALLSNNSTKANNMQDRCGRVGDPSTEDSNLGLDLHMHPLLFRASEDDSQPCPQANSATATSSILDILSAHPLKDNHSFLNFRQLKTPGPPCSSEHPKEPASTCTIDFHPLLQRSENLHVNSMVDCQDNCAPCHSELFRATKYNLCFNNSDGNSSEANAICHHGAPIAATSDQYEKEIELDLEIHLSSTKEGRKEVTSAPDFSGSESGKVTILDGRRPTRSQPTYNCVFNKSCQGAVTDSPPICPTKSVTVVDHHPMSFNYRASEFCVDNEGDKSSLQGIVMEQEDLSDTDEDIENVEFECEEMDDSEGE